MTSVTNAVSQYEMDYGRLPMSKSGVKDRDWDSDTGMTEGLITILKGYDIEHNSKETDYLGEIPDAVVIDGMPIRGIQRDDTGSRTRVALYDPWGHYYHIRVDGDGDGRVANPKDASGYFGSKIIVWSAGKDGDPDTWDDNVGSWGP